jgi:hypothetical protein
MNIINQNKFNKINIHLLFNSLRLKAFNHNTKTFHTPEDDYETTAFLGQGSSSRVFQGINVLTNKKVIIKLFKNIPK